jgi:4-amino-4-deoxychorismate lyase
LAGLKHLNRLENVLAASELTADASFDALMLDTSERLVSATASNVFLVRDGELLTPRVDRVGVNGILRQVVLREAARLGITAREQDLTLDDAISADGMFITNARIGVVPVQRVREHAFSMTGIAQRLRSTIEALDA